MISKTTVDNVFETARVEEVIGDFVQLKKSGSNLKGLSPFTDERTPSFMVSPVKQIWKDFSSGKGGNVIAFLMEHEHFTYPEAIKYLAKKYGIEIEETEQSDAQKEQANERESMYLVSEFANEFFQEKMHKTDEGQAIGLSYFKERGFTPETIKKFDLGYSPDDWEVFTKAALDAGYKLEYLEKTGLTIVKEDKKFDRFKGRVMFPIHSMSGRVLGFGGRILSNTKKAAKYLNSPESDIYHKSKVLYGIYHAKQAIAKEDNCYLVEGYTDVIQFHQSGIENTVSSSGTALTPEQIRLINRLTKNITVLFDGDAAGTRASLRGIDLILEQGMNVKVCPFPEGEDPDSFAKNNSEEELKDFLENNSYDFITYKASLLMDEAKNDPVKKAGLIRDMVNSIAKIPDNIQREVYLQECSRIMDISDDVLYATLAQLTNKDAQPSGKPRKQKMEVVKEETAPKEKVDHLYILERNIIKILLMYGNRKEEFEDLLLKQHEETGELMLEPETQNSKVFEKIYLDLQEDEIAFSNEAFQNLYAVLINKLNSEEDFAVETIINELEEEQAREITDILMAEEQYELHSWDRHDIPVKEKESTVDQFVSQTILNLRRHLIDMKLKELLENIRVAETEEERTDIKNEVMGFNKLRTLLSERLGRVM
ncbi:DNA primase [Pontixanthobacter gangjinensis]|uniref:DNA primase n=1 Tax=Christiangramia aestuarii TaxID=1028746 RepID=A0A7M3SYD7_9FLAO|nr:DNA primase [Christiangramia aestuarii]MUP41618.1 DNA primase [Christiangramia aestuarii]